MEHSSLSSALMDEKFELQPTFFRQTKAVLKKNMLVLKHRTQDMVSIILVPIYLFGLLAVIRMGLQNAEIEGDLDKPINLIQTHFPKFFAGPNVVAFAPCQEALDPVASIMGIVKDNGGEFAHQYDFRCFLNETILEEYAVNNAGTVFSAVVFASSPPYTPTKEKSPSEMLKDKNENVYYTILMNRTLVSVPLVNFTEPQHVGPDTRGYIWYSGGVVHIQQAIDQAIIQYRSNRSITISGSFKEFPYAAYTDDSAVTTLALVLPVYVVLTFGILGSVFIQIILEEKEKKITEGLKMIGLKSSANWTAWFITILAVSSISIAICTMILTVGNIFEGTSAIVILLFLFLSLVSTINLYFALSNFFSKARIGGTVSMMVFFVFYLPYQFVLTSNGSSVQTLSCLLSPTAIGLGARLLLESARGQRGMNFGNFSDPDYSDLGISFSTILLMLITDTLLYGFGAIYLENVVPSEFGIRQNLLYCLSPSYWRSNNTVGSEIIPSEKLYSDDIPHESVPASLGSNLGIQIQNLTKIFNANTSSEKLAVDGLSLDIYRGQITALLAHNGGGKTTTINMLTGMASVSQGQAVVVTNQGQHLNIQSHMEQIRPHIGVCPQHDVLFENLSVRDHLYLYATIKGIREERISEEISKRINEVGLSEKIDSFSRSLSGGMKRKLSVSMALLGDPSIVFLDEPTSGMDPSSRRGIWSLLEREKQHRAIILTTHFMDEADLLGDRIAILSKGKLQVVGSSLFLKSRFGIGYNLAISHAPSTSKKDLESLVLGYIQDARVLNSSGREISFQLPLQRVDRFPDMLHQLDNILGSQESYGLSITTLEEVFLRLANHDASNNTSIDELLHRNSHEDILIHVNQSKQDKHDNSDVEDQKLYRGNPNVDLPRQLKALIQKRYLYAKRDKNTFMMQCFMPVFFVVLSSVILFIADSLPFNASNSLRLDTIQWKGKDFGMPYIAADPTTMYQIVPIMNQSLTREESPGSPIVKPVESITSLANFQHYLVNHTGNIAALAWTNVSNLHFEYIIQYNTSAINAKPITLSLVNSALLRNSTLSKAMIFPAYKPLPPAPSEAQPDVLQIAIGMQMAIYIVIAFAYIPAMQSSFVVREREIRAKHQQIISGVTPIAYWLSNYIWDIFVYLAPMMASIAIFLSFKIEAFSGSRTLAIVLLFLFHGLAVAPAAYCLSFLFSKHSTAQSITMAVFGITCVLFAIATAILRMSAVRYDGTVDESLMTASNIVKGIGMIIPTGALGIGLMIQGIYGSCHVKFGCVEPSPFEMRLLGLPILILFIESFLFFALTIHLEKNWLKIQQRGSSQSRCKRNQTSDTLQPSVEELATFVDESDKLDEDVLEERKKAEATQDNPENIHILNLRKVYPPRDSNPAILALKDVSLTISRGECFGLLGPNGAGKTTMMSILTGELLPTSGSAIMADYDIQTDLHTAYHEMGYCPQFDAQLDLLTGRETLELYAHLKGIPLNQVREAVDSLLSLCNLDEYADVLVKTYSGGNKRKLSLAMALVGNPSIVLLDEPTTGVDPAARRKMWSVIASVMRSGSSIVLTSHTMEEADALSSRIGILINGQFSCLGSPQHLKSKYGSGYQIEIRLVDQPMESIIEFIENLAPGSKLLEWHGNFLCPPPQSLNEVHLSKGTK